MTSARKTDGTKKTDGSQADTDNHGGVKEILKSESACNECGKQHQKHDSIIFSHVSFTSVSSSIQLKLFPFPYLLHYVSV